MIKRIVSIIIFVFLSMPAFAAHQYLEKDYQTAWCNRAGGTLEFVLDDKARVDCLTSEYAVEVEFAPKWAESIGQALYYSIKTGKKPGVVLIIESEGQQAFIKRLGLVAKKYDISVWFMNSQTLLDIGKK